MDYSKFIYQTKRKNPLVYKDLIIFVLAVFVEGLPGIIFCEVWLKLVK